ncbi:MAG: efflux RND transporter periplasmic adaptor subunit [Flammeovirgaceae bacterium]
MKKFFIIFFVIIFFGASIGLGYYFYKNNEKPKEVFETITPTKETIIKKTVATGAIVPKKEVTIKPQVSGIIEKLYAEPGDEVRVGQLIAKIKVLPNMATVSNAESTVRTAKINLENAEREHKRQKGLFDQGVIAEQEYVRFKVDMDLAKESLEAAKENLQIIREGATKDAGASTTLVRSTVSGMILDIPFKEGSSVIESNTFNEGTTIATIADMGKMIFEGKVDESEVGKIKKGMDLLLTVGALEGVSINAKLDYISPKGVDEEGTIKFDIRATVTLLKDVFLRAGYSANADIVLDKKDSVLSIQESNIIFSGDTTFVEVETGEQTFEKREIKTGISDGINIEVVSGLTSDDKIKKL